MSQQYDPALRMALRQMLADVAYPAALRTPWVADRLGQQEPWTDDQRASLMARAKDWARTQGAAREAILRSLGEEIARDAVPRNTNALASVPAPTRASTYGRFVQTKETLPQMETKDNAMPLDEAKLSAVIEKMQCEPYWFPHDVKRLEGAIKLYREGKITLDDFGVFHVASRSKDKVHAIGNNECPCEAGQRRHTKWCAHLIGTVLYRKMHAPLEDVQPALFAPQPTIDERLAAHAPKTAQIDPGSTNGIRDAQRQPRRQEANMAELTTDEYIPEPDTPCHEIHPQKLIHSGAVMHEAPYSATISVENAKGYQLLLTVRKQEGKEFFTAVNNLLDFCDKHDLKPQQRHLGKPQAVATTPAAQTPTTEVETPVCAYHGAMKASEKAPGTYYCTKKMADGTYCKERWPKKAA